MGAEIAAVEAAPPDVMRDLSVFLLLGLALCNVHSSAQPPEQPPCPAWPQTCAWLMQSAGVHMLVLTSVNVRYLPLPKPHWLTPPLSHILTQFYVRKAQKRASLSSAIRT